MEYQKIANLIDDVSNQPSKFRTKNWVEINDGSRGTYNVNSQIKFKTTMLKSSLCDYSDAYISFKGTFLLEEEMMLQLDKQMKEIRVWHLKIVPHLLIA